LWAAAAYISIGNVAQESGAASFYGGPNEHLDRLIEAEILAVVRLLGVVPQDVIRARVKGANHTITSAVRRLVNRGELQHIKSGQVRGYTLGGTDEQER
jgi:hypothetical protein